MNAPFSKCIFLLLIMFCIKHSIAQSGVSRDSIERALKNINRLTGKPIAQPREKREYIYHAPLKAEPITHPDVKLNTLKHTANPVSKRVENVSSAVENKDTIPLQPNQSQSLYKQIKKIKDDSITQANTIRQLSKIISNKTAKDSSTQFLLKETTYALKEIRRRISDNKIVRPNITLAVGQVFSTFKFIDNQSTEEKNFTHNTTGCFSLGYWYALQNGHSAHQKNGLFVHANVGLRKAGASMVFEGLNINWTLQYADANIGLGYMLNKRRLKPYFSLSSYFGYMLKASQTIGTLNSDLIQNKIMNTTDFGLLFSPGVRLAISNDIALYTEYKYILGFQNIETSTGKETYNRGFLFNLGIAITLKNL